MKNHTATNSKEKAMTFKANTYIQLNGEKNVHEKFIEFFFFSFVAAVVNL